MKKTLKTALIIALVLCLTLCALPFAAAETAPFVMVSPVELELGVIHNNIATVTVDFCGDYGNYTFASDDEAIASVRDCGLNVYGTSRLFEIKAKRAGTCFVSFSVFDKNGNKADTARIKVTVTGAVIECTSDCVRIISGGCNPVAASVVLLGDLPDSYTLTCTSASDHLGLGLSDIYAAAADLSVFSDGTPEKTEILAEVIDNESGAVVGQKTITVVCDDAYTAGPCGDVNGDGTVTVTDARQCLRCAIRLDSLPEGTDGFISADVDFDGVLTVQDARIILRRAIGFKEADYSAYEKLITVCGRLAVSPHDLTYAFGDLDNDGINEMIQCLGATGDGAVFLVYTTDYTGSLISCGTVAGAKLVREGSRFYADFRTDNDTGIVSFQDVFELGLDESRAITAGEVYLTDRGDLRDFGEELPFFNRFDVPDPASVF